MSIDWDALVEEADTEVAATLRRALSMADDATQVVIIMEEPSGNDSTVLRLFSTEMSTNEQIGLISRGLRFSMEGNELDEDGRRCGDDEGHEIT